MTESRIPEIITRLYSLVDELEELFPERKFTLDGHLVGSIGEVVAKYFYMLKLLSSPNPGIDAVTLDGSNLSVQIKLTAGKSVSLADVENEPDILIVIKINRLVGFQEVFNGPYPSELMRSKKELKAQSESHLTEAIS